MTTARQSSQSSRRPVQPAEESTQPTGRGAQSPAMETPAATAAAPATVTTPGLAITVNQVEYTAGVKPSMSRGELAALAGIKTPRKVTRETDLPETGEVVVSNADRFTVRE